MIRGANFADIENKEFTIPKTMIFLQLRQIITYQITNLTKPLK